jgi:hypothetical protein
MACLEGVDYPPFVKNFHIRGYTIAGAAALVVGVAGNVQAIPILKLDGRSAEDHASAWSHVLTRSDFVGGLELPLPSATFFAHRGFFFFDSNLGRAGSAPRDFVWTHLLDARTSGLIAGPVVAVSPGTAVAVPDGASTALLLAAACGGLILLPRKRNA